MAATSAEHADLVLQGERARREHEATGDLADARSRYAEGRKQRLSTVLKPMVGLESSYQQARNEAQAMHERFEAEHEQLKQLDDLIVAQRQWDLKHQHEKDVAFHLPWPLHHIDQLEVPSPLEYLGIRVARPPPDHPRHAPKAIEFEPPRLCARPAGAAPSPKSVNALARVKARRKAALDHDAVRLSAKMREMMRLASLRAIRTHKKSGRPRSASEEALSHEECKSACERHYEAEHWFPIRRGAPVEPVADDADAGAGVARADAPPPLGSAPAAHHRHAHHKHHHSHAHAPTRGSGAPTAPRPAAPPAAHGGCAVAHSAHATPLRWLYGALSVDVLLITLVLGFALALVVA